MYETPVVNIFSEINESANQFKIVPEGAVAVNDNEPSPHLEALTTAVTGVGNAL